MSDTALDEEEVKKRVVKSLKEKGYTIVSVSKGRGRSPVAAGRGRRAKAAPPDIKARKGGAYYFVEAKGDPATAAAIYTAIGQIVAKMVAKTPTTYAIAFSPSYEKLLHLFPPEAQKKLHIKVLIPKEEKELKRKPVITEI